MPQSVTHVLISIILLSLFRDYCVKNKKTFPLHYVLIGGLAGLLPDLDVALFMFLDFLVLHSMRFIEHFHITFLFL